MFPPDLQKALLTRSLMISVGAIDRLALALPPLHAQLLSLKTGLSYRLWQRCRTRIFKDNSTGESTPA